MSSSRAGLSLTGLAVVTTSGRPVVDDVHLELPAGTITGLVGESGSGKTTVSLALLGFARTGLRIAQGRLGIGTYEFDLTDDTALVDVRGSRVSYVPQDPQTALNPSMRVGRSLELMLHLHRPEATSDEVAKAIRLTLGRVQLPGDPEFLRRFPHQLSGGQQQRVALALALVTEPDCVVLDEPTTGLDVLTKQAVMTELRELQRQLGITFVLVSHDLALVSAVCDRIAVMYAGQVVEQCDATALQSLAHPYSVGLVASIPDIDADGGMRGMPGVAVGVYDRPPGCRFAPRCNYVTAECTVAVPTLVSVGAGHLAACLHPVTGSAISVTPPIEPPSAPAPDSAVVLQCDGLTISHPSPLGPVTVVHGASLQVRAGECVALVGESGSGKTSIARAIAGLLPASSGEIRLDGDLVPPAAAQRPLLIRRRLQLVFQNPYDSLNPRHNVESLLTRPLRLFRTQYANHPHERVLELLDMVSLPRRLASSYPHEMSGGERQRVAIARALAADPDLVICDEITSALDVSVQANLLELLAELRRSLNLSMLFITHDLGVVANIADRTLVLNGGHIVEQGTTVAVLRNPQQEYTQRLVGAARWEQGNAVEAATDIRP